MTLFLLFGLIIALTSAGLLLHPLWQQPGISRRKKVAISLLFIIFMLVLGMGLYGYVGAPIIVMFTA